ncbi:hypothetical protein ACIGMX_07835 [Streptomyces aquilus]|uniref:hypothetical protein n=1 Tax=Streptomyces aquilus TaxID=2548456 RepID=UPI0037D0BAAE
MTVGAGWRGRWVGGALLLLVLLAAGAAHVGWVRGADGLLAQARDLSQGPEEKAYRVTDQRYRAEGHPPRTGTTELRVFPDKGRWTAEAKHELVLGATDPMVKDLRTGDQTLRAWMPHMIWLGGTADSCAVLALVEDTEAGPLTQATPTSTAYVSYTQKATWAGPESVSECPEGHATFTIGDTEDRLGKGGIYDSWTITIDAPTRPVLSVKGGTVLSQGEHRAELRLHKRGETLTVVLGPPGAGQTSGSHEQGAAAHLGALLQHEPPMREAFWLTAAIAAVALCWAMPFVREWSPPAARRRWTTLATVACVLTAASLLYTLAGSDDPPWPGWLYPGRGALLAVWWSVLLPYLLIAYLLRLTSGRAPLLPELWPVFLPAAVLTGTAVVFAVVEGTLAPVVPLAAAAVVTPVVAYGLRGGLCGPVGRRWATTAAGGAVLTVLAAGPGTALPEREEPFPVWELSNNWTMWSLNWGWYALVWYIAIAVERRAWMERLGWALLSAYTAGLSVLQAWTPWWDPGYDDGPWWVIGRHPANAASFPVSQLGLVPAIALLALRAHARRHDGWPPYIRTAAVGTGIAAVGSGLAAYEPTMFGSTAQRGGYYLALLIAALGFTWLLPPDDEKRAVRLHDTTAAAHNRRMHALLKDQTLAAGRREFLTASRTALAAGELTARQWSARWRGLGALGPRGTAPQHSVDLRLAALGTSGGRSALRNGTAAGVLLAALSVPWLAYTVPPSLSADFPYDVQVWAYGLRWAVYGFVYGYAYSWLRGGSPIGKSLCLLTVVLPAELAQLLYRGLEPRRFAEQLLLTTGNCLALFLILGLYWEARLVRVAGLRWGQIRNFRSLSAAAVPATTVLVASATALATAIVGVWIVPDDAAPADSGASVSVSSEPSPAP